MSERRSRRVGQGVAVTFAVAVVAIFALGACSDSSSSGGASSTGGTAVSAPLAAGSAAAPGFGGSGSGGAASSASRGASSSGAEDVSVDATATRVVKTGQLSLQVAKNQVPATVEKLLALTTQLGGYVSSSRTDEVLGSPDGQVTLRIPVGAFDTAVASATKLGHQTSLSTTAHDVTGKYVDLGARVDALQRTRATYLTILGRATSIGSTLEVQQRIEDVQQQIEELQGQLKVLANQSADGTLTVEVTQADATVLVRHHHSSHGLGAAWHRSTHRFARGIDAIVGVLGPLLLALLIALGFVLLAAVGYRLFRRFAGRAGQSLDRPAATPSA